MFIDPDIPIPDNMPKSLLKDFEILQKYYDADDWSNYELYFDGVESSIKSYYLCGRITHAEAIQLFHRFGLMV